MPNQSEFCEIVVTTLGIPIGPPGMTMYSTSLGFQAETRQSEEAVVNATAEGTDNCSREELEAGAIRITPKRLAMVNQLCEILRSAGWEHVSNGEQWFSLRFRR